MKFGQMLGVIWKRLLNWKRLGTRHQSPKFFNRFQKITTLAYIYQLAKFADLLRCGSKDIFKNASCLCNNTHHDVIDSINHWVVKNTTTSISCERNITFLRNKKTLNLCHRWHILRIYRFVAEVTLKCQIFFIEYKLNMNTYFCYK